MGTTLSEDLRQRVVDAHRAGKGTYAELAARFGIGQASVSRWLRLHRETGAVAARPRAGRPPKLDADGQRALRDLVVATPDATLNELRDALVRATGVTLARAAVHVWLGRLGLSRKKKTSTRPSARATGRGFCAGSSATSGSATRPRGCSSSTRAG